MFMSAEAEPFELFEKVLPHAEAKVRTDDNLVSCNFPKLQKYHMHDAPTVALYICTFPKSHRH